MENNKPNQPVSGAQNNVIMAVLAYLGILIIVPFLTDAKNDPFVKFHLKQGLVLLIFEVITWFIDSIPMLGYLVGWILGLATLVLVIIGIVNAVQNKEQELPVIGQYAKNFKF